MKAGRVIGGLALLLLVAGAGLYLLRDRLFGGDVEYSEISPEAAAQAEEKLTRLREEREPVQLSGVELSSLLHYRYPNSLPPVLRDPAIGFAGDTVQLSGRLATESLPSFGDLDRMRMLLPDTTPVVVRGQLQPLPDGRTSFQVQQVEVAEIPIPERLYPRVLERLRRGADAGLPENVVAFRLPPGIGSARVENSQLLLNP